ncbi:MAG: succinate dehydrogenase assembly factor 2 [Rhodospirillaceae bacterium]|nr:succinate dehydrogenase assembly factor 2 [Rhodospirillaceae bacterium]
MDVESRRKRLVYRATHRGTKESDVLVGGYFTTAAPALDPARFDEAERLLDVSDADLMDWLMERKAAPAEWSGTLFDDLLAHARARRAV